MYTYRVVNNQELNISIVFSCSNVGLNLFLNALNYVITGQVCVAYLAKISSCLGLHYMWDRRVIVLFISLYEDVSSSSTIKPGIRKTKEKEALVFLETKGDLQLGFSEYN